MIHDDTADLSKLARYAMEFCAIESCGKCTPCRIGSTRGVEVIDKIRAGREVPQQIELLRSLCDTMVHGSLCAMDGMTPFPVLSALDHYPEDFGLRPSLQAVTDPHAHDPSQPEQQRLDPSTRDRPRPEIGLNSAQNQPSSRPDELEGT